MAMCASSPGTSQLLGIGHPRRPLLKAMSAEGVDRGRGRSRARANHVECTRPAVPTRGRPRSYGGDRDRVGGPRRKPGYRPCLPQSDGRWHQAHLTAMSDVASGRTRSHSPDAVRAPELVHQHYGHRSEPRRKLIAWIEGHVSASTRAIAGHIGAIRRANPTPRLPLVAMPQSWLRDSVADRVVEEMPPSSDRATIGGHDGVLCLSR